MYSNARIANPLIARKRNPKFTGDNFQVGTIAPSFDSFVPTTPISRLHKKTKQLFDISQRSSVIYPQSEIFQLNPATIPFSTFRDGNRSSSNESSAVLFIPKYHETPIPCQARTTVEIPKPRVIVEHVGATHHKYPINVVGETLLKQGALLTINNLPNLIIKLREDLHEISNTRNSMPSSDKTNKLPKKTRTQKIDSTFTFALESAEEEIQELEDLEKQIDRIQRRISPTSDNPVGENDLAALKRIKVLKNTVKGISEKDARVLIEEAIDKISSQVKLLKTPAKGTYAASAAGIPNK